MAKNDLRIKYLGHSTFLCTTAGGKTLLIDPWVENNPACPAADKKLDFLDLMLITHGHGDHMQDAVGLARQFKPSIGCIYEISLWLSSKGVKNAVGMNKGGTADFGGIRVTMVNAHHSSSIIDDDGSIIYAGEPAGFVIELEDGRKIYHAGDTSLFGDMSLIARLYEPELVFLPIGDLFTMDPAQAAVACDLLQAKSVIPMHWGTFPVLTGTPEQLKKALVGTSVEVIDILPGQEIKW